MMRQAEVLEIIRNGENSFIEFKRDDIKAVDLAKEIVAFANTKGGRVLIGVDDDRTISGIKRKKIEEWFMNSIMDNVTPQIIPYYERVEVDDHGSIVVIGVDSGVAKPYAVKKKGRVYYYIRVGSESREADRGQLRRLFQSSGDVHFESTPVTRISWEELDFRRIKEYFEVIREHPYIPLDKERDKWERILVNNEYMRHTDPDHCVSTLAGAILFCRNPSRFLPQAGITAASFRSNEKDYDAVDRDRFNAPVVKYGVSPINRNVSEDGLIEQGLHFVKKNASHERLGDGGRRERYWDYPRDVVREVLVNAVAHRDYTIMTDIELCIYSDRLEVISPGCLPNTVSIESMRAGCRVPRNHILMQTLRDYKYVENLGMGVQKKIIRGMLEHNGTEPEFREEETRFVVRLIK